MPFPQCPNYEKNIQASITFTEMIIGALERIKARSEHAIIFKAELELIYREMKHLSYEEFRPTHMIVFEQFPILINHLSNALDRYFLTITTLEEVENHRKLFLPILNKTEKISCSFTASTKLPISIREKLTIHSFNKVRAALNFIFIRFAKQFPTNEEDIFNGEEKIPEKRRLTLKSGHQFDLIKLLQWQCIRPVKYHLGEHLIKYINPFTNLPLTSDDLNALRIVAMHLNMSLSFTLEDNPQKLKKCCDQYLLKEELLKYCQEKNYRKIMEIINSGTRDQVLADYVLDQAISNNDAILVDQLLKSGVSPNPLHDGFTPLINAAKKGHVEIGTMLLIAGANVNAYAYSSMTALAFATKLEGDDTTFIRLLSDHKVDVNQKLDSNRTALYEAVWDGKVNRAKFLLSVGAKIDVIYSAFGGIPIAHAAIYSKNLEMIKLMKKAGANFSEKNGSGETPLQLARALKLSQEIINFIESPDLEEARVAKKHKVLPAISRWTALLTHCEAKEKSEVTAMIKHFLFKNPDVPLPMKYIRTDNTTRSVLEYASEDKDLLTRGCRQLTPTPPSRGLSAGSS